MDSLSAQDKAKLLQNLHMYIVKHAPNLVTSERPQIPGIGIVGGGAEVKVAVHEEASDEGVSERNTIINDSSLNLSKLAKQKVELALTPQYSILKRKMAQQIRDEQQTAIILP